MRNIQITNSITDPESHVVTCYLQEVARTRLITPQEETSLARKIRDGDEAALEILIKANLRFVISVAKKYQRQGLPLSDLISEGNSGLIKAARLYDETKGFRFISFAVWWIRQSIMLAIAEQTRMVRLPMNRINLLTKIKNGSAALEQRFQRPPGNAELADFLEMEEIKISEMFCTSGRTISYDVKVSPHMEYALIDQLWNEEHLIERQLEQQPHQFAMTLLLDVLTVREKFIIELSYGLNGAGQMRPEDIARQVGITTERIRQLKRNGIQKMKERLKSYPWLANYLNCGNG